MRSQAMQGWILRGCKLIRGTGRSRGILVNAPDGILVQTGLCDYSKILKAGYFIKKRDSFHSKFW
jgi:hypothetical protein